MYDLKERILRDWMSGIGKKSLIQNVYYSKRNSLIQDKTFDRKMAQEFVEKILLDAYLKNILKKRGKIDE